VLADGGDGGDWRWGGRRLRGRSDWVFGHSASSVGFDGRTD
jgi:hypothetical protein